MPWCPNCRNEYRAGIKVCADCGAELVEALEEEEVHGSEFLVLRGTEFDKQSAKLQAEYEAATHTPTYEELAEADGEAFAGSGEDAAGEEALSEEVEEDIRSTLGHSIYTESQEAAQDNKNSGWVLLTFGCLGMVVVILGVVGVIPVRFGNPYLFYGVMSAVFLLFLIMGVVSLRNAKFFEKKAKSEHNLENTLIDWARENLSAEEIDRQLGVTNPQEAELMFFKRNAVISARLCKQFVNLDPRFVEHLVDTKLYDMIFVPEEAPAKDEDSEEEDD